MVAITYGEMCCVSEQEDLKFMWNKKCLRIVEKFLEKE